MDELECPSVTATLARTLESSSLGSNRSREARLEGARVLARHPHTTTRWLGRGSSRPEVSTLHCAIASLFTAEGQYDRGELWLRAALSRTMDGPPATRLAALLEQRRLTEEALTWYQRAADSGDPLASARLAVMCELHNEREIAILVLSLGRSQTTPESLERATALTAALVRAPRRRRAQLISDCDDGDLLFWAGSEALILSRWDIAAECYSAAAGSGHGHLLAAFSLRDLRGAAPSGADARPAGSGIGGDLDTLEILARAAVRGENNAVEGLLGQIHPVMLRYCRARINGWSNASVSAEDIAQEVCIAVLTALPGYRDQGKPFLAFAFGIAAHKVADARRSAARHHAEPVSEFPDHQADAADGPEQRAVRRELAVRLSGLLEHLPAKQREILVLRIMVGLSADETAAAVRSTPGAVRVAQHRALGRLRQVLATGKESI